MTKHTLQMPDDLFERLTTLATEVGQTPNDLILDALQQHIEDVEDLRSIAEYEQSKKDGTLVTYSLQEVMKSFDLEP